jgi:N-acetylglucosamine-6-phosphate deacetylase
MSLDRASRDDRVDRLVTERAGPVTTDFTSTSTLDLVRLMNDEDRGVPAAVARAVGEIAAAIDAIVERLAAGGRLVYVGAGTSGALAALDADECEATFSTEAGRVVAVVAGEALGRTLDRAAAEDDAAAGADALTALGVGAADAVVAVSASGRTPFVLGAIRAAAEAGALTVAVVCAPDSELERLSDRRIVVVVGPEFIAGSTRLKAGTAQKLVLNTISTVAMVRLGKTLGNLMVDVAPANRKLRERVVEIVATAAGVAPAVAQDALETAGGDARGAIASLLAGGELASARARRRRSGGDPVRLGVAAAIVGRAVVAGDVELADGRIVGVGLSSPNGRGIAAPGFVDLQVNGFGGVDLLEADRDGYGRAGEALLETGVTAYLPTFITAPEEQLVEALRGIPDGDAFPRIIGVHLEGPFLAPRRLGTHPASARRDPDPALLERLLDAGPVRMVTLAPELPGAAGLIELLRARRITVSCGHSDATAAQANEAFDRGVRSVTHLFNAMRPFRHRDPGIAGAALARGDVVVQIILDGVHLAPETASLVWRAAAGRVALVTDAVAGAGEDDGAYSLGGFEVEVRDGVARGPDGQLAGSALTMIDAVRNLHSLGIPLPDAIDAATAVPASIVGAADLGTLAVGSPADVVLLTDRLEIDRVYVGGEALVAR